MLHSHYQVKKDDVFYTINSEEIYTHVQTISSHLAASLEDTLDNYSNTTDSKKIGKLEDAKQKATQVTSESSQLKTGSCSATKLSNAIDQVITQFNNFDKELTNHKGRVMTWDWQYTNRLNGIETFAYTAKNINDNPLTFSYLDLVKKKYETDLEDSEISLDDLVKAFKILYDYPENYTDA